MIIEYTSRSSAVIPARENTLVTIEMKAKSFPRFQSVSKAPIAYSMDRKSFRATYISTAKRSTIEFCDIDLEYLPYVDELIETLPYREPFEINTSGDGFARHAGHLLLYTSVICPDVSNLQVRREGQKYLFTLPVELI